MSMARRSTKTDKDGRQVFATAQVPGKGGAGVGSTALGEGGKRGSEQVSHPYREGGHHKKGFLESFCKEIFGKLGELETHNTHPIGSHIR